ncbi:Mpo1-like protein, partial [Cupriavidus basilensis]|uniref:Mpo1-like protein n=1 Tax=Cupriavidus basilensis TaxID=68895 RepID=UPI0023E8045B
AAFYPYYLNEHRNPTCRRLHFTGSTVALLCLLALILSGNGWWLAAAVVSGYAFAWVGHFAFEKNRPATFRHPLYSLMGDWVMYADIWRGRIPF